MKHLIFLCFLFLTGSSLAQSAGVLRGSVRDAGSGSGVPFANVAVLQLPDSSLVTGDATDDQGRFELVLNPGNYLLQISFLSYQNRTVGPVAVRPNETVNMEPIALQSDAEMLEAVEITEDKSQMQLELDKRVFNVGKDLSNSGSNASEILANVPSVEVDVEGNVSLRGSENVRILIDGRPSGLTGAGNTDALRMLQGDLIEQVEVITNPSSKYDAEGEVGIINIVLKKEKREGINGSFEAYAGWPDNYGGSFSLNYRKRWFNLFASSGVGYRSTPGYGYSYNDYDGPDTSYYFENNRDQRRGGFNTVSRVGADFFINDYNTVTAAVLFKHSNANNTANIEYVDLNQNSEFIYSTVREELENEIEYDLEANVMYKKTFPQKGREWVTSASVNQNDDTETSDLDQIERSGISLSESFQRSNNVEDERLFLFQTDYVHPFGKKAKVETGLKASLRDIDNDYSVELRDTGDWYQLDDFTNELIYIENIYAAYLMHSNQLNRFAYQVGLRAEYSDIETRLVRTNQNNPREYLNFFPSVHLSYQLNERNELQTSYSRRISRPRFRELIPFFSYTDPRNFYSGNPNLNPEYTDSYEIGHLVKFDKGSLLTSVYYRHTTAPTERITLTDSTGLLRRFPVNLSTEDAYGLEANLQYEFASWLRTSISANVYQSNRQGIYRGRLYSASAFTANSRGMITFKLPSKTDLQLSGNYIAPRRTTQGRSLAMYTMDVGLSKDVLKGNGTITASARDLFNTRVRRWVVDTEYLYSESEFQWRSRQFLLTFNYRLNQKKSQRRDGGFEDGFEM